MAVVLLLSGLGCPIRFLTGVACPGCGLTRAWLAALSGDIRAALAYHPLFWCAPLALGLAVLYRGAPRWRRACEVAMAAMAGAFFILWIARLIDPADAGLLFAGIAPPGVLGDIVSITPPAWLRILVCR